MSLITTFNLEEDESGLGYYRRLARENGGLFWTDLARAAGTSRSRASVLGSPDAVAAALGLDSAWAHRATSQEQLSRAWVGTRRVLDALCPLCLAESCYLRVHWEHAYVVACPVHRRRLIDRCPSCSDPLKANRSHFEFCVCGFDLRSSKTPESTPAQHWLASLIASGGESTGGVEPRLERPGLRQLGELVRLLCLGADVSRPSARNRSGQVMSVAEAVEFLAPLDRLLQCWPAGFENHVKGRLAAGYVLARTLNTRLGGWYSGLKKICQDEVFEPFLRLVVQVAAKEFEGALPLDTARHLAIELGDHVMVADAADAWGVSRSYVVKAIKRGECAHRERMFGTRGHAYEVPKAEVSRVAQLRSEWIGLDEACEFAGITTAVLEQMLAAGVIRHDRKWQSDLCKAGPVQRKSIESLHSTLSEAARQRKRRTGDRVRWSDFASRRMGDKKAIQTALRAAANGELVPVAAGRQLGDVAFLRTELAAYFATPLLEAGMSVQQLATETGWKWETISHWINLGLLGAEEIELRGQPCRVITPAQLLAFRQTYVPLADLARAMGTKSSVLAESLAKVELVGFQVSPGGVRRGGLVRLADLGRLAVLSTKTAAQAASTSEPMIQY